MGYRGTVGTAFFCLCSGLPRNRRNSVILSLQWATAEPSAQRSSVSAVGYRGTVGTTFFCSGLPNRSQQRSSAVDYRTVHSSVLLQWTTEPFTAAFFCSGLPNRSQQRSSAVDYRTVHSSVLLQWTTESFTAAFSCSGLPNRSQQRSSAVDYRTVQRSSAVTFPSEPLRNEQARAEIRRGCVLLCSLPHPSCPVCSPKTLTMFDRH